MRFGEKLFRSPRVSLSLTIIFESIKRSAWQTTKTYWTTGWHAMAAWCLVGPLAIWVMYLVLAPALRKLALVSEKLMKRSAGASA
jgi:hypothetical protein